MFINDYHPFMNMLDVPGEEAFDENNLSKIAYPYFNLQPWIGTNGISYISGDYPSKTATSFAHSLSDIISAIIDSSISIQKFQEFNYDIGLTEKYDMKEYALSYILLGKK